MRTSRRLDGGLEIQFSIQLTSAALAVAGKMVDLVVSKQQALGNYVQEAAAKTGANLPPFGVLAISAKQEMDSIFITPKPTPKQTPVPTSTHFPTAVPTQKPGDQTLAPWPTTKAPTSPPSPAPDTPAGGGFDFRFDSTDEEEQSNFFEELDTQSTIALFAGVTVGILILCYARGACKDRHARRQRQKMMNELSSKTKPKKKNAVTPMKGPRMGDMEHNKPCPVCSKNIVQWSQMQLMEKYNLSADDLLGEAMCDVCCKPLRVSFFIMLPMLGSPF